MCRTWRPSPGYGREGRNRDDYLTQRGGAERVVLALCRAFPDAVLYTSLYDSSGTFSEFSGLTIKPLWLNRLPPLRTAHRAALPLLPFAWATASVNADVVICSSSGWAHGVRTDGRKIVYCHSPAKWLYRTKDYLGANPSTPTRLGLRMMSPGLRWFDRRAAATADRYLANSSFIAGEIGRVYGVKAEVVPPPVGLEPTGGLEPVTGLDEGFFLAVARLLPYKNVDSEAFRGLKSRLVVVGDGPQRRQLATTSPPNVTFLGEVNDPRLRWLYANCEGLVAASREDFGLTPVEAASFGKPVAALRWGGFLDSVVEGITGVFFDVADPVRSRRAWRC